MDQQQQQAFAIDGFIILRQCITATEARALGDEIDGLHERMASDPLSGARVSWEDGTGPRRIVQLMDSELVSPGIEALTRDPRLLDPVASLLGDDVLLFHSKLMMKSARHGGVTPWHQDWGYWSRHSREPSHVNAMLAIDAMDDDNGCIRFVVGSHQRGPIAHHRDPTRTAFHIGLPEPGPDEVVEAVHLQPGDVVLFGALVVHGSQANRSGRPRRANTFAFDRPGNREPELPPERMRRGRYPEALLAGPFSDYR